MSTTQKNRTWFITGCSSGFGYALTQAVIDLGDRVVTTARQPEKLANFTQQAPDRVLALPLDVTKAESVSAAIDAAIDRFGRIDVLVNNAGYGLMGAIEELSDEEIRKQFDTNVFGLLNVTRTLLPHLRKQRSGHIVNISSIAGLVGSAGLGGYCATKFAVEGISEALAQELAPFGIAVTIIEPGGFNTNWGGSSMQWGQHEIKEYTIAAGNLKEKFEKMDSHQLGDPAKAARAIIEAVQAGYPPLHLPLTAAALQMVRQKMNAMTDEFDRWESVALAVNYDSVPVASAVVD
ncbi:oxidoreductase [Spirosoma arcticum]